MVVRPGSSVLRVGPFESGHESILIETDSGRWVVAAMASEIPARTTRPSDPVPVAFGEIGYALHQAWGR